MRSAATARLFVAVEVPAVVCEQLAAWARAATRTAGVGAGGGGPVRVLDPGLLHLTLCFLGSRPVEEIESLGATLEACAEPAGELSVGAPLWLPPRRPRALAVEIHDDEGGLESLHEAVSSAIARTSDWEPTAGGAGARRRLRPHVTVARMRAGSAPRERRLAATPQLSFTPEALILYRSWLSPAGASYQALASRRLAFF